MPEGRVFVRPAREGLLVPDPFHGTMLPAEGAWVNWSGYWQRQLDDKDIVIDETAKES